MSWWIVLIPIVYLVWICIKSKGSNNAESPYEKVRYGNRGMWLENAIIHTNKQYRVKQLARIDKVPTDISYNTRTNKAYYKSKGTVDFTGLDKDGRFIAFDTKIQMAHHCH